MDLTGTDFNAVSVENRSESSPVDFTLTWHARDTSGARRRDATGHQLRSLPTLAGLEHYFEFIAEKVVLASSTFVCPKPE